MLNATPKTWTSSDFSLEDSDGTPLADLGLPSSLLEQGGSVALRDGSRYIVGDRNFSPLVMEAADGPEVAHANGLGPFHTGFAVTHGERQYILKPIRRIGREWGVFAEGRELGRVRGYIWFSRRVEVEIADEVPLVLQVFLVWLTLLRWQRDWHAGSMPTGG